MQSTFTSRCPNHHSISLFCTKPTCPHPSPICSTPSCNSQTTSLTSLYNLLINHAKRRSKQSDHLILTLLNKMLKSLEILKNQYLSMSDKYEYQLTGERKRLYELMRDGPAKEITGGMVLDVLENNVEEGVSEWTVERLREITERVEKQHVKGVEELRRWIKSGDVATVEFAFSPELTNPNRISISNHKKTIRQQANSANVFSLISPPTSSALSKKLHLKLLNENNKFALSLGVASRTKLSQCEFRWTPMNAGVFIVMSNGVVLNHLDEEKNGKEGEFEFRRGDVMELEYLGEKEVLRVGNLRSKRRIQLEKVKGEGEDLCFCVQTRMQGDEWEIVEEP